MNAPARATPARRRVDAEYWMRVLEVMRKPGASVRGCARELGADKKTITKLWTIGVPGTEWGKRAMREVVIAERDAAKIQAERAAAAVEAAVVASSTAPVTIEEADAARRQAIATRAEELKLVRYARTNVQAMLAITTNVTKGALTLSKKLMEALEKPTAIPAGQALLLLTRAATITQKAVYAAETIIELERMVGGDPRKRVDEEGSADADEMDDAEAIEHLVAAKDALARAAERGLIVIPGGREVPAPPAVVIETPTTEAGDGGDDAPG